MKYESGVEVKEKLVEIAEKYGLTEDPIYLSNLKRYLELQELQEKYFKAAELHPAELPKYIDISKEANACARILRQRMEEVAGDSIKYSDEAKKIMNRTIKEWEGKIKDVVRSYESKLSVQERRYERELRVYDNKIADLNKQLLDRTTVYKTTVKDVNERVREVKREKEIALQDLEVTKRDLLSAEKEVDTVKKELEATKEKLRTARKDLTAIVQKAEAAEGRLRTAEKRLTATEEKVKAAKEELSKIIAAQKVKPPAPKKEEPKKEEPEPVDPDGL